MKPILRQILCNLRGVGNVRRGDVIAFAKWCAATDSEPSEYNFMRFEWSCFYDYSRPFRRSFIFQSMFLY